jgi:hypothetical protein
VAGFPDWRAYDLPVAARYFEAENDKKLVERRADLSKLGMWIRIRRWMGHFPKIYVVNFASGWKGNVKHFESVRNGSNLS